MTTVDEYIKPGRDLLDKWTAEGKNLSSLTKEDIDAISKLGNDLYSKGLMKFYVQEPFMQDIFLRIDRSPFTYTLDAPAAIGPVENKFRLFINPIMTFVMCDTIDEFLGLLEHESLHMLNRHFAYNAAAKYNISPMMDNIGSDAAINQLVSFPLPKGGVDLDYIAKLCKMNRSDVEEERGREYYIELLAKNKQSAQQQLGEGAGDGKESADQQSSDDQSNSNSSDGSGSRVTSNNPQGDSDTADKFDKYKDLLPSKGGAGQKVSDAVKQADKDSDVDKISDHISNEDAQLLNNEVDNLINITIHNPSRGYDAGNWKSSVVDVTPKKPINWTKILPTALSGMVDDLKDAPWRPSRRHPYNLNFSGTTNAYRVNVYAAVDTSGSITDRMASQALAHIKDICKKFKATLTVIECDSDIKAEYTVKRPADFNKEFQGRGGTSYQPVFERLIEKKFDSSRDILVYFTDGYGEDSLPKDVLKKFDRAHSSLKNKNVIWVLQTTENDWKSGSYTDVPAKKIGLGTYTYDIVDD